MEGVFLFLYSDNSQICLPDLAPSYLRDTSYTLFHIFTWMSNRHLKYNVFKIELLVFPSNQFLPVFPISVSCSTIHIYTKARNVGVILNCFLFFTSAHSFKSSPNYIRNSFIAFLLYCNSILSPHYLLPRLFPQPPWLFTFLYS